MTVGEWIRREREKRGWSRDALAFRCHISPRLLAKYEAGESEPGTGNLEKIAAAYDTSLPWRKKSTSRVKLDGIPLRLDELPIAAQA